MYMGYVPLYIWFAEVLIFDDDGPAEAADTRDV
jgi:hypothetical protein